jgi:hypothetical protein
MLLTASSKAKGEAVNVGNTKEVSILVGQESQRNNKMQINNRI